ncbi:hypothetical protein B4O97_18760 [Marispirochaeta aestuarii]|uniref:Mutarotase n=1 Tax=Marispirochaeta aestuarii TaxID=1963862 RepID=A0A1Y1RU60_9SPIO|nr:hypothetical protein [Marispirochaeta aestuarii]ORC29894.1 hypothetical protein B4O97_18760 [Marispirochaeta aestuarii]
MDLDGIYDGLYNGSVRKISNSCYTIDDLINSPNDTRRGISLIFRPSSSVRKEISRFLDTLQQLDPNQYYYPESDMHVTILSIVSCYPEFNVASIHIPAYINLLQKAISDAKGFTLHFRGITASPSCVMIRGFPENNTLNDLRNNLRSIFKMSSLEHSIDKRYELQTAHSTVLRFRDRISDISRFLEILESYKDFYFGSCTVDSLEFVVNDWYLRKRNTEKLFSFSLPPGGDQLIE